MRIAWIDNLKGLAIIAVIIGHMTFPFMNHVYSWHVPLFFFVSGLLLNKNKSIKSSLKNDFSKLIIPFVAFCLVGLSVEYLKRWLFPGFAFINGNINFKNEILGIFWWMDYSHLHQYGFVLWFLPALFWAKNIYLFLFKLIKNKYIISVMCLLVLLLVSNTPWALPFGLTGGLMGVFWLSMYWLLTGRFWGITLLMLLFLPVPETNIAISLISIYGVAYSLIAINSIVGIVKLIPKNFGILGKFGKETMPLLIIHPYINNIAYFLIIYKLKGNWPLEVLFTLFILGIIVKNMNTLRMVFKYIIDNNEPIMVPIVIVRSLMLMMFQALTKKEITKNIGLGRRIILFPKSTISRMFLYTDVPDKKEIDFLRKKIDRKSIFLDIGANIGSYSVLLSDLSKNIYAFEPSPISNERCKKNFRLNNLKEKNVVNIALSDKKGSFGFTDFGGSSTTNRLTDIKSAKIQVQTDSLDNWVKKNIKVKDFNLVIKIDVEGNEEKVIKGASSIFRNKKIKGCVIEISDDKSKVFDLLKSYGYKVGSISGRNYYVEVGH